MNPISPSGCPSSRFIRATLLARLTALSLAVLPMAARSQTVVPPAPTPPPPGVVAPVTTVTPGLPDPAEIEAYNAARTPVASIVLGSAPAVSTTAAASSPGGKTTNLRPVAAGGAFPQIDLSTAPAKGKSSTAATPNTQVSPTLATVTLTYHADRAGSSVWVQTLGGGTLSVVNETGTTISVTDGFPLEIGPTGVVVFSYQAPSASNTYQVTTRLDNVVTTLNFLVPDVTP